MKWSFKIPKSVTIKAAWISGICTIIAAFIALSPQIFSRKTKGEVVQSKNDTISNAKDSIHYKEPVLKAFDNLEDLYIRTGDDIELVQLTINNKISPYQIQADYNCFVVEPTDELYSLMSDYPSNIKGIETAPILDITLFNH